MKKYLLRVKLQFGNANPQKRIESRELEGESVISFGDQALHSNAFKLCRERADSWREKMSMPKFLTPKGVPDSVQLSPFISYFDLEYLNDEGVGEKAWRVTISGENCAEMKEVFDSTFNGLVKIEELGIE